MRRNSTSTDRSSNFEKRLRETMGSELDPEMVTPMTGGSEELSEYDEKFPLIEQFRQTNMHSRKRGIGRDDSQRGLDQK